jgi:hypothetical protein
MAWPNPFRRKDENTRNVWGYTFQWTPGHVTPEEMHPLKFSYDVLGEECLNRLDAISPPISGELPRNQSRTPSKIQESSPPKRDLYALLRDHASEDSKLTELWDEVTNIPEWVDVRSNSPMTSLFLYDSPGASLCFSEVSSVNAM